ncbi:uncharacterized protein [Erythrolamprus reginae]|uniref:uncharacterized protein n=1 Tax=Erythrolamprus reginae TaxID=121349 RepID=UPI00396CBF97
METGPGPIPADGDQVWVPVSGPFCKLPECSTPEILHTLSRTRSGEGQRPYGPLAPGTTLCVPTNEPYTKSGGETPEGKGRGVAGGSTLAPPPVVFRSGGSVGVTSMENSGPDDIPQPGEPATPRSPVASTDHLALERLRLRQLNLLEKVIDTMQAARRPSTSQIYQTTWAAFCGFCDKQQINPRKASVITVLEFLQAGIERGLALNTLKRHVAALSTMIQVAEVRSLAYHPWVKDFMRGASNQHSPPVRRFPSWDLTLVLRALTKPPFEPLRSIPLQLLSIKTAFLVAITSARRVSELSALSVRPDLCIFYPDRVVLRLDPSFIPKVNTEFHRKQELILPDFCTHGSHPSELRWHKIDVRRAVKIYIRWTETFRKMEKLFISFSQDKKGLGLSSTSISRWIRDCIAEAYKARNQPIPAGVTAHSTRSAATSAAWVTQASIDDICRAARWSVPSTFIRHYKLDSFASAEAAFGRRVLQ